MKWKKNGLTIQIPNPILILDWQSQFNPHICNPDRAIQQYRVHCIYVILISSSFRTFSDDRNNNNDHRDITFPHEDITREEDGQDDDDEGNGENPEEDESEVTQKKLTNKKGKISHTIYFQYCSNTNGSSINGVPQFLINFDTSPHFQTF